ncbi:hypothetical protein N7474_005703 [Penicillium riverlandense]|uniref:uncharacterized protein n=1 Tax=Penicillium riverlandense TaxID=1903569 RepID=UPI00254839D2|nr:uncharacterized protein N7474_005703 [Penicillium riverlandense]KAJ5820112.1 hypothetical protein N7474_005703 [Penicillium riverlandense]
MPPKYSIHSSSDSEEQPSVPSDDALEKALREAVATVFKAGNLEELTVKRVRLAVEKKLGLEEGFFKSTNEWKARSDHIIKDEVNVQDNPAKSQEAAPIVKSPSPPLKPETKAPKRTKSASAPKPRKRQKTETPVSDEEEAALPSEEDDFEESEEEVKKPKKRAPVKKASKKQTTATEESDFEESEEEVKKPKRKSSVKNTPKKQAPKKDVPEDSDVEVYPDTAKPAADEGAKDDSESEMSVVLDEEPKPPRKRKKSTEATAKSSKKEGKKAAPKAKDEDLDPDQAEIKRLQGWLVKCGIRKMWWRELAPYETPKAKIRHLKDMLEDAGMKGRYSLEKASQIREERELKADLEEVQQGAKQWGMGSGEESDAKPRRRQAPRSHQALAFLDDESEESD